MDAMRTAPPGHHDPVDATTPPPKPSPPVAAASTPRYLGVDAARGLALLGMMAVHIFAEFGRNGTATVATVVALGRSMATFVLLAGVSLAFMTGGRRPVQGRARSAAVAGIAVRAALIGLIGLVLAAADSGVDVILSYYAVFFLLAIPLLGRRPRVLVGVAAASIVCAPLLLHATFALDLPSTDGDGPTFETLLYQPGGLLLDLLLTGDYPALPFLVYIAAGLAIGRMDLSARWVALRLLGGGLALAAAGWLLSWILLHRLGGLGHLVAAGAASADESGISPAQSVRWDMEPTTSWWWLAGPAPHSTTPIDLIMTLGAAIAVLGAMLLLTQSRFGARLTSPLAAAGSMTLTLYSAHVLVLAAGVFDDGEALLYAVSAVGALTFAVLWRRWRGQGPLEHAVAIAANAARRGAIRAQVR